MTAATPLIAQIAGGTYREVQASQEQSFDASGSRDPDAATGATQSFAWSCMRQPAGGTTSSPWTFPPGVVTAAQPILRFPAGQLESGAVYNCTILYRVVLANGFVRSATASTTVSATNDPIPTINLVADWDGKLASQTSATVPVGLAVRILSNAASSLSSSNVLAYSWRETLQGLSVSGSSTLMLPVGTLSEGVEYEFEVTVTDTTVATTAKARLKVIVSQYPTISSLSTSPSTGRAFEDFFTLSCAAQSAQLPLTYQFSYTPSGTTTATVLSIFRNSPTFRGLLPAGNHSVTVTVRDALGVTASKTVADAVVVTEPANADPCALSNRTVFAIISALPYVPGQGGQCGVLERGLAALVGVGRVSEALFYQNQLSNALADARTAAGAASGGDCAPPLTFGCSGASTTQEAATQMDAILLRNFQTTVNSTGNNRATAQELQSLVSLSAVTTDIPGIAGLTGTAEDLAESLDASDLATSTTGLQMNQVVDNLVTNAMLSAPSPPNASAPACVAAERAARVLARVNARVGATLVLGSNVVSRSTTSVRSSVEAVLLDGRRRTQPTGMTARLPDTTSTSLMMLSSVAWGNLMDACRPDNRDVKLDTGIYSVTLALPGTNTSIDIAPNNVSLNFTASAAPAARSSGDDPCGSARECVLWDAQARTWSSNNCTYVELAETDMGACECTRLGDFRVVTLVEECEAEAATALPIVYFILTMIFSAYVLGLLSKLMCARKRRMSAMQWRDYALLLSQAVLRVGSCAVFWQDLGATLEAIAMAVGMVFAYFSLCNLFFMWASACHTARLSPTSIEQMFGVIFLLAAMTTIVCIGALAYGIAAVGDPSQSVYISAGSFIISSGTMLYCTCRFIASLETAVPKSRMEMHLVQKQQMAARRSHVVAFTVGGLFVLMNAAWLVGGTAGITAALVLHAVAITVHFYGNWRGMGAKHKKRIRDLRKAGIDDGEGDATQRSSDSSSQTDEKRDLVADASVVSNSAFQSIGGLPRMSSSQPVVASERGSEMINLRSPTKSPLSAMGQSGFIQPLPEDAPMMMGEGDNDSSSDDFVAPPPPQMSDEPPLPPGPIPGMQAQQHQPVPAEIIEEEVEETSSTDGDSSSSGSSSGGSSSSDNSDEPPLPPGGLPNTAAAAQSEWKAAQQQQQQMDVSGFEDEFQAEYQQQQQQAAAAPYHQQQQQSQDAGESSSSSGDSSSDSSGSGSGSDSNDESPLQPNGLAARPDESEWQAVQQSQYQRQQAATAQYQQQQAAAARYQQQQAAAAQYQQQPQQSQAADDSSSSSGDSSDSSGSGSSSDSNDQEADAAAAQQLWAAQQSHQTATAQYQQQQQQQQQAAAYQQQAAAAAQYHERHAQAGDDSSSSSDDNVPVRAQAQAPQPERSESEDSSSSGSSSGESSPSSSDDDAEQDHRVRV